MEIFSPINVINKGKMDETLCFLYEIFLYIKTNTNTNGIKKYPTRTSDVNTGMNVEKYKTKYLVVNPVNNSLTDA